MHQIPQTSRTIALCHFMFGGPPIECCCSVTHLGHTLTANVLDRDDIFRCSRNFIRKAKGIVVKFGFCDTFVLNKLPVSVCLSMVVLYGHFTLALLSIWMCV